MGAECETMGAERDYLGDSFKGAGETMGAEWDYLGGSFKGMGETGNFREAKIMLQSMVRSAPVYMLAAWGLVRVLAKRRAVCFL